MKRTLILLALLLGAMMLFASCDLFKPNSDSEPPTEEQTDPNQTPGEEGTEDPTEGDVEEPIPHEHVWDEGIEAKTPTCKEEGVKVFTCTTCGEVKTEVLEKATEHTWDEGVETLPPTLTKEGEKTFTCTICGETKTEVIPVVGTMSEGSAGGGGGSIPSGGGGGASSGGGGGSSTPSTPGQDEPTPTSDINDNLLEPDWQEQKISAINDNILEPDMKGEND